MNPYFSSRTTWNLEENSYARSIRLAREAGRKLLDLTVSNPTACGFHYDAEALLAPLSSPATLSYDPNPQGMLFAREAVAAYYAAHKATVDPGNINLTTSTSEAYGYLFRLLCNAGDEVLVPQPSYPLFDYLADLEDVRLRPYPLFYDYGWWIDFDRLERSITPRTRAILLVHPNNPTGHATRRPERERLEALCQKHNLALIVDEVFLDYSHEQAQIESFAVGPHPALTFLLSGMSKIAALPQMKVGWILTLGPDALRREAIGRLEVIADTFLSMNAPAQYALPTWLNTRHSIQKQILHRVSTNHSSIQQSRIDSLQCDGGWSCILRLPSNAAHAEALLAKDVVVHPGDFYGISESGRIVVSLITPQDVFSTAIARIAEDAK